MLHPSQNIENGLKFKQFSKESQHSYLSTQHRRHTPCNVGYDWHWIACPYLAQCKLLTDLLVVIIVPCDTHTLLYYNSIRQKVIHSPTDRQCQDAVSVENALMQWWNSASRIIESDRLDIFCTHLLHQVKFPWVFAWRCSRIDFLGLSSVICQKN